jgi:hypothetical protein
VLSPRRRWIFSALLSGSLSWCGGIGGGTTQTCLGLTITYTGSKSGAAYLRIETDGGITIRGNGPSVQDMILAESGASHCIRGGDPVDFPFTAAAWIDVAGTEATVCADLVHPNPQCQPSPTDPQAHQSGVERYGQTTQVRLDVVDPP